MRKSGATPPVVQSTQLDLSSPASSACKTTLLYLTPSPPARGSVRCLHKHPAYHRVAVSMPRAMTYMPMMAKQAMLAAAHSCGAPLACDSTSAQHPAISTIHTPMMLQARPRRIALCCHAVAGAPEKGVSRAASPEENNTKHASAS